MKAFVFLVLVHVFGAQSFVIPDEIPSVLSVIYSNIPTIKKGTDSRIGWGFRLGNRADFQTLIELGPQTETKPLANQNPDTTNKRSSINTLSNDLYAQQQHEKRQRLERKQLEEAPQNQVAKTENQPESEGSKWLRAWSNSINQMRGRSPQALQPKPGLGIGEIDAKSVIPEEILDLPTKTAERRQ